MASELGKNYIEVLQSLKEKIRQARLRASFTANTQLLQLYWQIGNTILLQQQKEGWGTKVIDRLAADLKSAFPDMKGLSVRNIKYMRAFAEAYPDFIIVPAPLAQLSPGKKAIVQQAAAQLPSVKNRVLVITQNPLAKSESLFVQQAAAQIPWTHHQVILDKLKNKEDRFFYICKSVQNGWSREVLTWQIESKLHKRQGKAITNFDDTLPPPQSDLAKETLKNPYLFDFLSIGDEMQEREMEKALIQHIKKFLLELGRGFDYVGNQFNIAEEEDDYFLDLLFYNYHLHCFIVFELKLGKFKPEYAGKLNFYINTVDEQIKGREDKSTLGVLLCKTPNHTTVKYALKGIKTPMGVADYEFAKALPKNIKSEMPTIEELETMLEAEAKKFAAPADKKLKQIKKALSKTKSSQKSKKS